MHPQLSDKKLGLVLPPCSALALTVPVCKDFMEALEQCHSNNWARLLGHCNRQKEDLNACLREERLKRTTANREASQERKIKAEESRQKFYKDSDE
ncbi:hypothetical protein C8F01DRAFT_985092 [Mycena amicta]|nr:hypothetical protein C8F01DRAFT_985092 [Mycena amicta]